MKISILFICVKILILSLIPCTDIVEWEQFDSHTALSRTFVSSSHSEEADTCSPFCNCICCSTATIFSLPVTLQAIPLIFVVEYPDYPAGNLISSSALVWQPPKLG
ncbi:hypothetical protein H7F33_08680 [Pedobacter sp. PAMC26386]|nr:hypothetical protein H7F33_08680 [Pedobacter sp. PAMC26386]